MDALSDFGGFADWLRTAHGIPVDGQHTPLAVVTPVRLYGVIVSLEALVGEDFPPDLLDVMTDFGDLHHFAVVKAGHRGPDADTHVSGA